ncbi:hypothetical protein BTJ40_12950 [Microbulbifer sp. A4B17]|uniref:hypothetical protein n=1 Tax=Microbulbifer sp. A4B17 TaxID=359370 RepID=UPI000D52DA94|nr:hypothetical protein [Microbulbifer sp. A4B17]AWF81660.1 hypothetical protein BTJ40_12950 [Microbulbifer sp. A4B17]
MIRHLVLTIAIILFSCGAFATAQRPDKIVIKGEVYSLNTNPLESYLNSIDWELPEQAAIWSSNWRGYLAEWEVADQKLVLVDMTIALKRDSSKEKHERKSILNTVFPGEVQVFAQWYSGTLIVPSGKIINYVHVGYGSSYERYQVLAVNNGNITKTLNFSHAEFISYREEKFSEFQKTELFKKEYENLTTGEHDWSNEEALGFLQSYYAEYYLSL